jgi:hypothetical protein
MTSDMNTPSASFLLPIRNRDACDRWCARLHCAIKIRRAGMRGAIIDLKREKNAA